MENLRAHIGKSDLGLASHTGLCERLMAQAKKLESEEQTLRAKADANRVAGNRQAAGQYALRLEAVARELEEHRTQLRTAAETYGNLAQARDAAFASARAALDGLVNSVGAVKMRQALADLTEMESGTAAPSGATIARLRAMIDDDRPDATDRPRDAREPNGQQCEEPPLR